MQEDGNFFVMPIFCRHAGPGQTLDPIQRA